MYIFSLLSQNIIEFRIIVNHFSHLSVIGHNIYDYVIQPKSEKVGTVWKTQIKKESSDF